MNSNLIQLDTVVNPKRLNSTDIVTVRESDNKKLVYISLHCYLEVDDKDYKTGDMIEYSEDDLMCQGEKLTKIKNRITAERRIKKLIDSGELSLNLK